MPRSGSRCDSQRTSLTSPTRESAGWGFDSLAAHPGVWCCEPYLECRRDPRYPPLNNPAGGPSVTGVLDGPSKAKNDGIELKVRHDTAVRVFTLTYPVGSTSGWHSHPGVVVATVDAGTVRRQIGRKADSFSVGDTFTEPSRTR